MFLMIVDNVFLVLDNISYIFHKNIGILTMSIFPTTTWNFTVATTVFLNRGFHTAWRVCACFWGAPIHAAAILVFLLDFLRLGMLCYTLECAK
jgi:hypothetical protein